MPDISRFHFAHTIFRWGSFAPTKIRIPKHRLRKSRQFSPPPCRFQPVQNLRDLRKRVRSRKTSEKLDQKTKETREERPRDGAGEAERGEGRGPQGAQAALRADRDPAPPLPRPPPPRPSASLLLSPLPSDQVFRRFSLNELFFEDLSSFELVGTCMAEANTASIVSNCRTQRNRDRIGFQKFGFGFHVPVRLAGFLLRVCRSARSSRGASRRTN